MSKSIHKNRSKNLNRKYSQKLVDHVKESATDAPKTASERTIQYPVEETVDFIGNIITDKITKVSKTSQQNNSETVTNEHDKEIFKERKTSPEGRQKIINDLRLI